MDKNKLIDFFTKKKVIVTGGTGLIGRSVVNKLCDYEAEVTIISLDKINVDERAEHVFGDLTDFNFSKKVSKGKDYALHMSGIKGSVKVTIEKPASFFVPLIMMNTNFLEACRQNSIKKLVYTSSIGAYSSREIFKEEDSSFSEPPMDMFPGWAKRMAELQIQAYKKQYDLKDYYIVRPCVNVYGLGLGAKKMYIKETTTHIKPGYFWCEWFEGRHLTVDYEKGKQIRCVEGFKPEDTLIKWDAWKVTEDEMPMPNIIKKEFGDKPKVNIEFIGGKVIEMHFRHNVDFEGDRKEYLPVWKGQSTEAPEGYKYVDHPDVHGRIGAFVK